MASAAVNQLQRETITSLPGEGEPAAFSLRNIDGDAPLLIACDHASNRVPAALDGLGIDQDLLDLHIGYDIGSAAVAQLLMEKFNAPLLCANYSRLVIDLNRHLDDPTLIPEVSDGHVIPGNQSLQRLERQARIDGIFIPYHDAYRARVDILMQRFRRPLILAVHSFTPSIQGVERPWDFGVLWDRDKQLATQLIDGFKAVAGRQTPALVIGDNQPYHARAPLGYAMVKHGEQLGVEMALIEIRQDLVTDAAGQHRAAEVLYEVLAPILDHTMLEPLPADVN